MVRPTPDELRFQTFRDLYFAERNRRESIRGSIGVPASAVAFALYAFIGVVQKVDVAHVFDHIPSIVMLILGVVSVGLLFAAVWRVVRTEWLFVYNEPPDIEELVRIEKRAHEAGKDSGEDNLETFVARQVQDTLTAGYYIGWQRYTAGNTNSAHHRTWSVRLVFMALMLLFLAAMLLPFHINHVESFS